jgi:hypothetical protein
MGTLSKSDRENWFCLLFHLGKGFDISSPKDFKVGASKIQTFSDPAPETLFRISL